MDIIRGFDFGECPYSTIFIAIFAACLRSCRLSSRTIMPKAECTRDRKDDPDHGYSIISKFKGGYLEIIQILVYLK